METKQVIRKETLNAIDILLSLFTKEQKEILEINLNNQKITLLEQFVSRWWSYVPISENPLVFKADAAKIIIANKNWLEFIDRLKNDDIFGHLLDPRNYKEENLKKTKFKMTDKRKVDSESSSGNLVRTLARTTGGESGNNRAYDYTEEWDRVEKERLDNMSLSRNPRHQITTETGNEDDGQGAIVENQNIPWIDRLENLDPYNASRSDVSRIQAKFLDSRKTNDSRDLLLHTLHVSQSTNATSGESGTQGATFVEALKRQEFSTMRERLILADAINNIQNIDFMDVREKIYKKLDTLFVYKKLSCH